MTEGRVTAERDLTGIWNGLYTYPHGQSTSFVAILIETGGSLAGTTHEPGTLGDDPETTAFATLSGSRRDSMVTFTKRYDRLTPRKRSPILYEGVLNGDGTEIEGRWSIPRSWSGKFLMIRSAGKEAKISRKAFARV